MKKYLNARMAYAFIVGCVSAAIVCFCYNTGDDASNVTSLGAPSTSHVPEKFNVFATTKEVNVQADSHGQWAKSEDSEKWQWSYEIQEDASSLNFGFSEFVLPPSAEFTICNQSNTVCQQFLPKTKMAHHLQLWTPILKGNYAKMTLTLNEEERRLLRLKLTTINKGIKNQDRSGNTQECLIDVICTDNFPQINEWENEIQAVGLISIEGTRLCSGVLLNNVREDFTPYFLTARHCGINADNAASVVVHWNYENSVCRFGDESNKEEGDGSLLQFNSGATLLSDLQASDFTLLLLDEPVVDEADAYYAGWDARSAAPVDVTTIHHANTEEKRITFGSGETSITRHFGEEVDTSLNHIKIENWSISSTSGGSSGGPLFDANHRVVGQLHGGLAACDNEESDWFGRFYTSWEGDSIPERQLRHWLDPDNTGQLMMDGIEEDLGALSLQISIVQLSEINCAGDSTGVIRIDLRNGVGPFSYSIDGGENFQNQGLFNNLAAGFYSVLVRDTDENTSAIVPFFVNEPDPIILSFDQLYNQVTLSIEGGEAPYLFTNNGNITFDSTFTDLSVGTNLFKVVDSKGCSTELEIDLFYEEFQSQLEVVKEIQCNESENGIISIQHSGTAGPYMYRLNSEDLSTNNIFENLPPGNYTAWVIDSLGNQSQTETITLTNPEVLVADLNQVEENVTVNVQGGVAPYMYQYDEGKFTSTNTFPVSGNVEIVVVRDANECTVELVNMLTSTDDSLEDDDALSISPNPANGILWLDSVGYNVVDYKIYNSQGQELLSAQNSFIGAQRLRIDISNLDSGIYFFKVIMDDNSSKLMKFIVL